MSHATESKWRLHGAGVVHAHELDTGTVQTPGQQRAAVNLDLPAVGPSPEYVHRADNIHPAPPR